jgi:hypothetical protein
MDVHVQEADFVTAQGQTEGQVGRYGALTHAAFAGKHHKDVTNLL